MPLAANTPINVNLHYMNFTDHPILKEVWVNFWYRDPKDVKQATNEVYSFAPMNVAPGQHVILSGTCPIDTAGRVLTLYGHRHATTFASASTATTPARATSCTTTTAGKSRSCSSTTRWSRTPRLTWPRSCPVASSGPLDLAVGDNLYFEDIVNNTQNTFVGQNEAKAEEMCIMIGDSVGTTMPGFCTYNTQTL